MFPTLLLLCGPCLDDLFALGFSEAGRPAALQPHLGGADHDHRVSGWWPRLRVLPHTNWPSGTQASCKAPGPKLWLQPGTLAWGSLYSSLLFSLRAGIFVEGFACLLSPHDSSQAFHVSLSPQRVSHLRESPMFLRTYAIKQNKTIQVQGYVSITPSWGVAETGNLWSPLASLSSQINEFQVQ